MLCTRIGIMARGRLRCLGTQGHLKKRFGEGYLLTVMSQEDKVSLGWNWGWRLGKKRC